MIEAMPCPTCFKVLYHYKIVQVFNEKRVDGRTYQELYAPYKSWSPKGRGGISFTKHAFECLVCGKRWVTVE